MNYHQQEALQRIQTAKLQQATSLDLTELKLTEIPETILQLPQLAALHLSKNKIADFAILKNLPKLNFLSLRHCRINDISSLKEVSQLQKLDVVGNSIEDYSVLQQLPNLWYLKLMQSFDNCNFLKDVPNLKWLDLNHSRVKDYRFLHHLKSLTELELEFCELERLDFLENLPKLQLLNLKFNKLINIDSLRFVPNLSHLNLAHNKIIDISPLASLKYLKTLQLRENQLQNYAGWEKFAHLEELHIGQNNLTDIRFLKSFKKLKKLSLISNDDLTDLNVLKELNHLTELNLAYLKKIQDFAFLDSLPNLTELHLTGAGLKNIEFLKKLTQLQILTLEHNRIQAFPLDFFDHCKALWYISLSDNPIKNIPTKLLGEPFKQEYCCEAVRNYCNNLKQGTPRVNDTLKVAFVGNARVGKTSLMRVLVGEPFDSNQKSTHAIHLKSWSVTDDLRLNLWDFGGQHLYHATHRLFLRTEALFILVWEQQNNILKMVAETDIISGKPIHFINHQLQYWLHYLNRFSKNAPIFLVQTKIDEANHKKETLDAYNNWKKHFQLKDSFHVDSKTQRGIAAFKEELIHYAKNIAQAHPLIPESWYQVRLCLQLMQNYNKNASGGNRNFHELSLSAYFLLCAEAGLDDRSSRTLLNYLHDTGEIFYTSQLFNNQIIINQDWLIHAIYTLFDRDKTFYKMLRKDGRFTFEDVNDVWAAAHYTFEQQKQLIEYMRQCEICFEVTQGNQDYYQREWVAPYLLPEKMPLVVKDVFKMTADLIVMKMQHELFYYSIIQSFIIRARHFLAEYEMWRYGIYLTDHKTHAIIQADEQDNSVTIQVQGIDKKNLADKIRKEFDKIHDIKPQLLVGKSFIPLEIVEKYQKEIDFTWEGNRYLVRDFACFLNVNAQSYAADLLHEPALKTTVNRTSSNDKIKVLMLTANPADKTSLKLEEEHSNIVRKLQNFMTRFIIKFELATDTEQFRKLPITENPTILHFSGHGEKGKYGGLYVQNRHRNDAILMTNEKLDALFNHFKSKKLNIHVVVLNACHSEAQAQVIAQYIPIVIGTTIDLDDNSACAFSIGFYDELAQQQTIDFEAAFKEGVMQAVLEDAKKTDFVFYLNGKLVQM